MAAALLIPYKGFLSGSARPLSAERDILRLEYMPGPCPTAKRSISDSSVCC